MKAYLSDAEASRTIPLLISRVEERMTCIKREAEWLEYRGFTDQAFQHQIASLCVYVSHFKQQILDAEKGVDYFIDNSANKRRAYFLLHQDLLRLILIFGLSNATVPVNSNASSGSSSTNNNNRGVECLTRVPKLEQASNFNVIKINAHFIDIQYSNKALIIPPADRVKPSPPSSATMPLTTPIPEPQILEILQPSVARDTVLTKLAATITAFQSVQKKMAVYMNHYARLGNKEVLKEGRLLLHERLDEVVYCIQEMMMGHSQRECEAFECCIAREVEVIKECFDDMLAILDIECDNCSQYVFNTITRFMTCSTDYAKLLTLLRHHKINPDEPLALLETAPYLTPEEQGQAALKAHYAKRSGWGYSKWD